MSRLRLTILVLVSLFASPVWAAFPLNTNPLDATISRADEHPITGPTGSSKTWAGPIQNGVSQAWLTNNQIVYDNTGVNAESYVATSFAEAQEAQIELAGVPLDASHYVYVFIEIQNPGSATALNAYFCGWNGTGGTSFGYFVNNVPTFLSTTSTAAPAIGHKLGCQYEAGVLTGWYYQSGVWTAVNSIATSAVTGGGYVGVEINGGDTSAKLINFLGGATGGGSPPPPGTGDYYVDKAGSNANSCATAATAQTDRTKAKLTIAAGIACVTSAGKTVLVGNGIYIEGQLLFTVSGTSGSPITLKAENQHQAILSSTSGCSPNVSIAASYIVIDGMRIRVDTSDTICTPVDSASGTAVRCWNSNNPSSGNPTTGNVGCTVRNSYIDASSHRGHAIKMNHDYALVENNTVYGGVEGMQSQSAIIRNNYIEGGDWWGNSVLCKGGSRSCQVYNNVIKQVSPVASGSNAWLGLVLGGQGAGQWAFYPGDELVACYQCVAWNNVITSSGSGQFSLGMMGCHDCTAFNNVVIAGRLTIMDDSRNSVLKNNILSCGSGTALAPSWAWADLGTPVVDYNNFYNCTGAPTQTHAISGNPLLVNEASDWHLQVGSPALNEGTTISLTGFLGETLVTNLDKDGSPRSVPWDLGLYENTVLTDACGCG